MNASKAKKTQKKANGKSSSSKSSKSSKVKAPLLQAHPDQSQQIKRLNKIAGQINGIRKMIEEKRQCLDILMQTRAVCSAIKSLEASILQIHLQQSIHGALSSKDEKESLKKIDEVTALFKKNL